MSFAGYAKDRGNENIYKMQQHHTQTDHLQNKKFRRQGVNLLNYALGQLWTKAIHISSVLAGSLTRDWGS